VEEFAEIDMNLDDVPDKFGIIPSQDTVFNIISATRTNADKDNPACLTTPSPNGKWPYIALKLNPISDNPDIANKELQLVLSFNPKALFNMKELRTAVGLPTNVNAKDLLNNIESDKDYVGKRFGCTPTIEPSKKDPNKKVNQLNTPYRSAR
jgi:hypothetical protein